MGTFQLENDNITPAGEGFERAAGAFQDIQGSFDRERNECIIALKVYDQCRQQECLTADLIGPARAAVTVCLNGQTINEGDIVTAPENAATVSIEGLNLKKVIILEKEHNAFRPGYWDINLKYVFEYKLIFREACGDIIGCAVPANSIYNKKVTLFGSVGTDIVMSSDLFSQDSETVNADPFVLVEAKAIALAAELRYCGCRNDCCCDDTQSPAEVVITIGLFSIIQLFRLVNLTVRSHGFCVPDECEEMSPLNPCEYFESLEFPFDMFSPPQKAEFFDGEEEPSRRKCGCQDD